MSTDSAAAHADHRAAPGHDQGHATKAMPGTSPRASDAERADTAAALHSATGVIRSEVGRQLGLRHTPSLEFVADVLPESAQRIEELVTQARHADTELAQAREGASYAGDPDPYRKPAEDDDEDE